MNPVRWHPEASLDLVESLQYYEACEQGLGERFMAHVDAAVARVAAGPQLCRRFEREFRRARIEVFPFSVIFRERPGTIQILALAHSSRDPGYWQHRV